jgi:16S rRNA (adenine1518-N6/adenine1519-N6)-dimethyltransferase
LARRKLGQHFLSNPRILRRIAEAACPRPVPLIIEIGPGRGALTERLLERASRVIGIEIDPELAGGLRGRFKAPDETGRGLTVIEADAREIDLDQWGAAPVAGNLPYYAATPILERLVRSRMTEGVFLIQKEVAERIAAAPGSRAYGYLSVFMQSLARVELLFKVPPGAFSPPPKVDSAVIRLTPAAVWREHGIGDPDGYFRFVSACFRRKRKTLRNNLEGLYRREVLDRIPEASRRAEELTNLQFARLYQRL